MFNELYYSSFMECGTLYVSLLRIQSEEFGVALVDLIIIKYERIGLWKIMSNRRFANNTGVLIL